LYTHFLLGDRSMRTFRQTVLADLEPGAVAVHDRYHNHDSAQMGELNHQLCLAHVLRDLASAAELYPDRAWPTQLATELRELIHRANQARDRSRTSLPARVKDLAVRGLRSAVAIGLAHTEYLDDTRPGARKTRLLLEALRRREDDFLRFTTDLRIPPTSNQAERDLRPAKIRERLRPAHRPRPGQGPLPHPRRALHRRQAHRQPLAVLRDAFTGTFWLPSAARPAWHALTGGTGPRARRGP
jgi:hypothetical protein